MEGLIALATFALGWQISYEFWKRKIRSDESARVMSRVLNLESALRWEKARADAFQHDIERHWQRRHSIEEEKG